MNVFEKITVINFILLLGFFILAKSDIIKLPPEANHPHNIALIIWLLLSLCNWAAFAVHAVFYK